MYERKRVFIIGEVGLNHNGDIKIAKKLIKAAKDCGCDAVKFQKRTIDLVYSKEELNKYRESPWGNTNRKQKEGLEFGKKEYDEINKYCKKNDIEWFASAWDVESQLFLRQYDLKYNKIASAMLTHKDLVKMIAEEKKYTFISTGMSTIKQIEKVVDIFEKNNCLYELMHCNSIYPTPIEESNLRVIQALKDKFGCEVGFSSHEAGIIVTCAAVSLGASSIERHITLDRTMYGSDQAASLEIVGLRKLVSYIRAIESSLGTSEKLVSDKEKEICKKLRKIDTL